MVVAGAGTGRGTTTVAATTSAIKSDHSSDDSAPYSSGTSITLRSINLSIHDAEQEIQLQMTEIYT